MPSARTSIAAAVCVGALAAPSDARAQGTYPEYAFGHPGGEIALGVFAGASNGSYFLPQRSSGWAPFVVRAYDPRSAEWSDMFGALGGSFLQLGVGYAFEAGYLQYQDAADPGFLALRQAAVEAESLLLTSGITALIKRVSGRCRPRAYKGPGKPCKESDAFPSGHTSAIASFSGARLVRLAYTPTNEGVALRLGAFGFSEAATIVTGTLRVLSGSHSWEDVVVGGVIGYATGITVSLAHPNRTLGADELTPGAAPAASPAWTVPIFQWGGSF